MKPNGNFWALINFLQTLRPFALLRTDLPENLKEYITGNVKITSFNFKILTDWSSDFLSAIGLNFNMNEYLNLKMIKKLDIYDFGTIVFLSYFVSCIMGVIFPVALLCMLYIVSVCLKR